MLFTCTCMIRLYVFFFLVFLNSRRRHFTVFDLLTYTFYSLVRIFPRSIWKTCINETLLYVLCEEHTEKKMVLLRQQINWGKQINFLLLQPKLLLQQPNVLFIEVNFLLL